jgi:hypothetical protein
MDSLKKARRAYLVPGPARRSRITQNAYAYFFRGWSVKEGQTKYDDNFWIP